MNLRKNKNRLNEDIGAFSTGHMQKSRPLTLLYIAYPWRTFICTSLRLHSPASHYRVLSLTPPTLRNRHSTNKQPRPTVAAGAGATSVGKPDFLSQSQQTKQPGS